jgi:hypothetical protein
MKKLNYKSGAIKRKFKMKGDVKAGDMIKMANEQSKIKNKSTSKINYLGVMGLI